jgi:hypothetical protein
MGAASGPDMITDGLVLCLDAGSRESYPVSLPSNGLYGRRYVGYFNDNVNWFETATLHGDVNQLTAIDNFTSSADFYSWQWIGYFKPSTTENYTFFTSSDDASYLWIGNNATAGFTTANANVNNAGLHGNTEKSSTPVSLTKGVYYPIRIQFGENGGGDIMSVSFSTPTISKTRNGLGYYYNVSNIQNTWKDLSNNGNNGTLTNGPLFGEENIGILLFDGVDDYIEFGDVLDLGTNSLTVNHWINLSVANTSQVFLSKALAGGQNFRFATAIEGSKLYAFMQGDGGSDIIPYGSTVITANTWFMATYVFDRTSSIKIYYNGVQETLTGTATISQWNGSNFQSINPFRVGTYTSADNIGTTALTNGKIGITQVYFRALTPAEILQNYNALKGRFGI